jgi:hypothetical protein
MAITFDSANSGGFPLDNSTNTGDPQLINFGTLPTGSLVCLYAWKRNNKGTITITDAAGQTWNAIGTKIAANATLAANFFWCRWDAAADTGFTQLTFGATTNNSYWILIFNPTTSTNSWAVDAAQTGTFVDRAAAASFSVTGWTPNNASNVNIAIWNTQDDNTWGTLTGTNWTKTGLAAQLRNTSGNDTSASVAYQIQTSAAATNNVSQTQLTLGNDAGLTFAISFYESATASPSVKKLGLLGVG